MCDRCGVGIGGHFVPKGFPVIEYGAAILCDDCIKYMVNHGIRIGDERWPVISR
jgi:hypothetical protein